MMLSPSEFASMSLCSTFTLAGQSLRDMLENLSGWQFQSPHSGTIQVGTLTAQFMLEREDQLHICCPVMNVPSAEEALASGAELPGDLRYTGTAAGMMLLADVPFAITPECTEAIEQIVRALAVISGESDFPEEKRSPPSAEEIDQLLADSDISTDDLVRMDSSWELRPRLRGEVTAVQLTRTDGGVRLRRNVLPNYEACSNRNAVALQALLLNAELRGVRLATAGQHLVAECHLPVGLLTGKRIVEMARAVGVAYRHTQLVLEIVGAEEVVSAQLLKLCS